MSADYVSMVRMMLRNYTVAICLKRAKHEHSRNEENHKKFQSKARVQSQYSLRTKRDNYSGTVTRFSPGTSVSPVSIIPSMLNTHLTTTHAVSCFSTSTSFPCQYHSTNAPYSSTNDAVQSNKNKEFCHLHNMRRSRWCERNVLYTCTRLPGLVRI